MKITDVQKELRSEAIKQRKSISEIYLKNIEDESK